MRTPRFLLPMALVAAVALAGCHKQKPAPSIDGLTAALQHSAEQALTAPSLANEQVILTAKPADTEAQAAAVLKAATDAGGAGVRSSDGAARISILATIPENNAEAFKAALHHVKVSMDPPSTATRLIEVLIETPAPSPTP